MGSEENIALELEGAWKSAGPNSFLKSKKRNEQTGNERSPEPKCQWVPLPGKVRESLTGGEEAELRLRIGPVTEPPHLSEHSGRSW